MDIIIKRKWWLIDWLIKKNNGLYMKLNEQITSHEGNVELTCWCWGRDWIVSTTGDLYTFDSAAATWSILTCNNSQILLQMYDWNGIMDII